MRFYAVLILMFMGTSLARAGEDVSSTAMRDRPSVRVVGRSDKLNVVVNITTALVSGHDPRLPMCAGTTNPCRGVERLQIVVNGRDLFVPVSSFFDLSDLRDGKIVISGNEAVLSLKGGDASESYQVNIKFNGGRVISRALFSMLTPGEPLQETTYHEVFLD